MRTGSERLISLFPGRTAFFIPEMPERAEERLRDSQGGLYRPEEGLEEAGGYQAVYGEKQGLLDFRKVKLDY